MEESTQDSFEQSAAGATKLFENFKCCKSGKRSRALGELEELSEHERQILTKRHQVHIIQSQLPRDCPEVCTGLWDRTGLSHNTCVDACTSSLTKTQESLQPPEGSPFHSTDEDCESPLKFMSDVAEEGVLEEERVYTDILRHYSEASEGILVLKQKQPDERKARSSMLRFYPSAAHMDVQLQGPARGLKQGGGYDEPMQLDIQCRFCCVSFTDMSVYERCSFCTRTSCLISCSKQCESCCESFCNFCLTVNYDFEFERTLCIDCNRR